MEHNNERGRKEKRARNKHTALVTWALTRLAGEQERERTVSIVRSHDVKLWIGDQTKEERTKE